MKHFFQIKFILIIYVALFSFKLLKSLNIKIKKIIFIKKDQKPKYFKIL